MRRFWPPLVSVLLLAGTAQAYILPPEFLLKMMVERRRDAKVRDLSIILSTERTAEDGPFEERLYLKRPFRLRRVEQRENGRLYVERDGLRAQGTEESLRRISGSSPDLLGRLMLPPSKNLEEVSLALKATLEGFGVDTQTVTMGRLDHRPAYIVGATSWEPEKPQIWIDKSTFLPVRVTVFSEVDGDRTRVDTILREYGSAVAGNWFPRVVETYYDGLLARRAEVTELKINEELPETLFQVP